VALDKKEKAGKPGKPMWTKTKQTKTKQGF
jgi:hypothetical protein